MYGKLKSLLSAAIRLDPDTGQWHRWSDRWLVIRFHALAQRQNKGLEQRLQTADKALAGLYDGNPRRTTARSTAERLLTVFCGITLYFHPDVALYRIDIWQKFLIELGIKINIKLKK